MAERLISALVVTVSNRAAAGVYEDRSGPVLAELLRSVGCIVDGPTVVPDGEPVEAALRDAATGGYDVVVTTGGTGLTPGDLTVNLPGSTGGVRDGMAVLSPVLEHAVSQINGGDHQRADSGATRLPCTA